MAWSRGWRPYVPVAQRRAQAKRTVAALRKRGITIRPVEIEGRKIASTFWGEAWCDHLESFRDYENRLPRGRTYVRNGSVCHLDIAAGKVTALVSGTDMYNVGIRIRPLAAKMWKAIRTRCAGRIGSLLELLQGRLSDQIMEVVTDRKSGLFPRPREIEFDCDCPDWATMCKHVAAVCYGVGARLDTKPDLLFRLREVDHDDLITADAESAVDAATKRSASKRLASDALGDVFGIDLDDADLPERKKARSSRKASASRTAGARKKTAGKTKAKRKAAARKKAVTRKATASKKATKRKVAKKKAAGRAKAKSKATPTKKAATRKTTASKKATKLKVAKKRAARKAKAKPTKKAATRKASANKKPPRKKVVAKKKATTRKASTGKKAAKRMPRKKAASKRNATSETRPAG